MEATVRVKYKDRKKYFFLTSPFQFKVFLESVAKKFDLPTLDIKVYDETRTEIDDEAFEYILKQQDIGVLEIVIPTASVDDSFSSSLIGDGEPSSGSDDTAIVIRNPSEKRDAEDRRLGRMIEDILKSSPGGDKITHEYARTKTLSDVRRRDLVKILVAHLTNEHGTSPPRRLKEEYAKGIICLFPYLADPLSKLGYEHFYNAEDGSGYLAWRIKTLQKEVSEGRMKRSRQLQTGGPTSHRDPLKEDIQWDGQQCQEAIALMKHSTDEVVVKEKMRLTLAYRQKLLHDPENSADILSVFPRFLDIPGLIDQDFRSLFGDATSAKMLEKWTTNFQAKVVTQCRGLTLTGDVQDLIQNAEATEVDDGWDSDMSSMLLLVHLLPPSSQGRKRPGKISARQACDSLVKFIKIGTSIQAHLDNISGSLQPYLLAVGAKKSMIESYYIVIDKHALPCKTSTSLACVDELFKAHFVFGTRYCQELTNVYTFLQTTVYDIDVENTKVNPRVAELRARMQK
ncbi:uncharacterized protein LOC132449636 isoform X1 [Gadus macrocephalus]|uniref:uncharacterized protein LOC132446433 isoform X1 n=1 Tax=Gadus macrocephalus TaxID=80720 RepID=UPI0028CBB007|nr:uncharacterized protein LOC132446433 isoform X1 [Gadus macrocephalus]XP_059897107.1 uncharacterized protein LOC132449474 isoform X1 [Gadus macrocephalus]XP_059897379.1 uncharacterized protein LOC132449636 isoform X1 [Gadus macrocephalus]